MDKCPKCNGRLIKSRVECEPFENAHELPIYMLRCINCGGLFDKIWLENRKKRHNDLSQVRDRGKGKRKWRWSKYD